MKRFFVMLGLAALLPLTGCTTYKITMSNGNVITTRHKPKLDKATNTYQFKDPTGKLVIIPSMRIREIEAK
jgi:hypothetical protein